MQLLNWISITQYAGLSGSVATDFHCSAISFSVQPYSDSGVIVKLGLTVFTLIPYFESSNALACVK